MKNLKSLLAVVLLCAMALTSLQVEAKGSKPSIQPTDLTCEYQATPLLDIQNPRFAWVNTNIASRNGAAQTAYRIRVADSADGFDNPVWDSGKVESDDSAFITYQGPALKSRTSYWWQVQVWDEQGNASEWSAPAMWHMGLLSQDEWQGKWIGAPWQGEQSYDSRGTLEFDAAPLLRKEFKVKAGLKSARYYGTGVEDAGQNLHSHPRGQ
jgi:alpha-L-rhamnosidase